MFAPLIGFIANYNRIHMKNQWKMRVAKQKDSMGLSACMEKSYSFYQSRLDGKRLPPMDIDYSAEIQNYPCWVVEQNGLIVGGLIMMFEKGYAQIANIAVHPDYQGQGLGRGIMEFAENKAKENNYSKIELATHILLTENISLYSHLGWKESGRDEVRVYFHKEI